jgi:acetyltransferase/esterase
MAKQAYKYTMTNAAYWMGHELWKSPRVEPDLDELKALSGRVVLAGGRDSRDQLTYPPNSVLARQLGREIVDFPCGHLGFMSHPAEFAKALMNALGSGSF